MKMLDIKHNLSQIWQEITNIAEASERQAQDICLVAVSKTKAFELIQEAHAAGQRHFAENYVQEAINKIKQANEIYTGENEKLTWHYIGKIQSNKCALIAGNFSWAHSLSSFKHAQRLNRLRPANLAPLNICLQVQLKKQTQRNGVSLDELDDLFNKIYPLDKLSLRGLMCVLPEGWRDEQALHGFQSVQKKFFELKKRYPVDTLSLGMSADFPQAIQAGSNMLRLGSSIFGARNYLE